MEVEQILTLIQVIGGISAFSGLVLVAQTIYMGLATPPKELQQYIIDTTPEPEPEPVPKKRVVTVTVPQEVQEKLNELLPAAELRPGWDRIGGAEA